MGEQGLSILLIEDDHIDREMVLRYLRQSASHVQVTSVRDGLEALQLLQGQTDQHALLRPALILLALGLPRLHGFEFLHQLRKDPGLQQMPVLVLTGSSNEQDQRQAAAYNVLAYLVKEERESSYQQLLQLLAAYQPAGE